MTTIGAMRPHWGFTDSMVGMAGRKSRGDFSCELPALGGQKRVALPSVTGLQAIDWRKDLLFRQGLRSMVRRNSPVPFR
jgi:hypothetical protein